MWTPMDPTFSDVHEKILDPETLLPRELHKLQPHSVGRRALELNTQLQTSVPSADTAVSNEVSDLKTTNQTRFCVCAG